MVIKQSTVTIMFEIPIVLHIFKKKYEVVCIAPHTSVSNRTLSIDTVHFEVIEQKQFKLCVKSQFSSVKHILCHAMHLYRLLVSRCQTIIGFCGFFLRFISQVVFMSVSIRERESLHEKLSISCCACEYVH